MKNKWLKILFPVLVIGVLIFGTLGSGAWLSDKETSTGNTLNAGTLDLNIDGGNTNVVKFTVNKMVPGNQPVGQYKLKNVGDTGGYLDLNNITLTTSENGITEPEAEAGDQTADVGELQDVVGLTVYWDNDCDGYYGSSDVYIYNGMAGGIGSDYNTNKFLPAGATQCVMMVFNWWSTANDNLAQGDGMVLNTTFTLSQIQ